MLLKNIFTLSEYETKSFFNWKKFDDLKIPSSTCIHIFRSEAPLQVTLSVCTQLVSLPSLPSFNYPHPPTPFPFCFHHPPIQLSYSPNPFPACFNPSLIQLSSLHPRTIVLLIQKIKLLFYFERKWYSIFNIYIINYYFLELPSRVLPSKPLCSQSLLNRKSFNIKWNIASCITYM